MRISDWSSDVCSSDLRSSHRRRIRHDPESRNTGPLLAPLQSRRRRTLPRVPRMVRSDGRRSEEHTSELQSLMRISYAVFCLKKKSNLLNQRHTNNSTTQK